MMSCCPGLLIVFRIFPARFRFFSLRSVFFPYEKSPEFFRSAFVLLAENRLKIISEAYANLKIARKVEKSILHYSDNFDAALSVIISVTRQFEHFIRL